MYKAGAREKLIQEQTGHRSIEALRSYERSSEEELRQSLCCQYHSTQTMHTIIPLFSPLVHMYTASTVTFTPSFLFWYVSIFHSCITSASHPPPQTSSNIDILTETEHDELVTGLHIYILLLYNTLFCCILNYTGTMCTIINCLKCQIMNHIFPCSPEVPNYDY